MDGISELSVDYSEDLNKARLKVRVGDKWLDLLMDEMEATELANKLLMHGSLVKRSVESNPIEGYNNPDEERLTFAEASAHTIAETTRIIRERC